MRWAASGHTSANVASRICSRQFKESLCSSYLVFSPRISLQSNWCSPTVLLALQLLGRIPLRYFIFICLYIIHRPLSGTVHQCNFNNTLQLSQCCILVTAILNKSWRQHPTKHQLYGHLPPITKTIQVGQTRHAGHCWRSRDELISDVLLWTPTYSRAKAGRPARTYIQQLCEDMGCSPEDLPEAMNDWEKWRERVRNIRASGTT